ncbi:MAG: dockerin type I domain-containing protein, partial [Planctomycetota bacterium]
VLFDGGDGSDRVFVEGSAGSDDDAVVTDLKIEGGGNNVGYTNVELIEADFGFSTDTIEIDVVDTFTDRINVFGGEGADTFDVLSGPLDVDHVFLYGDNGDDTFNFPAAGIATTSVEGGSGIDTIVFSGTSESDSFITYRSLDPSLPRPAVAVETVGGGMFLTSAAYFLDDPEAVTIGLGDGVDRGRLRGGPAGIPIRIDLGPGDDEVDFDPVAVQSFAGDQIAMTGGDGDDRLEIRAAINTPADYTLLDNVLGDATRDLIFDVSADIEELLMRGSLNAVDDTFTVAFCRSTAVTVRGNNNATTTPGDELTLISPGGATPDLTDFDPNAGSGTYTLDTFQPVTFTGIETATLADTTRPRVLSLEFARVSGEIVALFSEDVSSSIGLDTITVTNLTTGATLPSSDFFATFSGGGGVMTELTLRPFNPLPDGRYRAEVTPGSYSDAAGNVGLIGRFIEFTVLTGDANGDGTVDLADFGILRSLFGQSGASLFADFNDDGVVDLADFGLLRANFGVSV